MLELGFRSAMLRDVQQLKAIAQASPGAPDWTSSTWQQVIASALTGDQRLVLIAELKNEALGFGVIGLAADQAEIESLAVHPAWRRLGIATSTCEALMSWAQARGADRVFLEVRVSNAGAQALYRRLGFEQQGLRRRYYRDPEEDAMVMVREL